LGSVNGCLKRNPKEVYPMLHDSLSAIKADLIQCPEQHAFEFADISAPTHQAIEALPMRCPGRENYLLWRAEFSPRERPYQRLCLEVIQESEVRRAILSPRLQAA
jgi:hypothetical protein